MLNTSRIRKDANLCHAGPRQGPRLRPLLPIPTKLLMDSNTFACNCRINANTPNQNRREALDQKW